MKFHSSQRLTELKIDFAAACLKTFYSDISKSVWKKVWLNFFNLTQFIVISDIKQHRGLIDPLVKKANKIKLLKLFLLVSDTPVEKRFSLWLVLDHYAAKNQDLHTCP